MERAKKNWRPSLNDCPEKLQILIRECWQQNPELRPSARKVLRMLNGKYQQGEKETEKEKETGSF